MNTLCSQRSSHTYPSQCHVPSRRRRSSVILAKSSLAVFKLGVVSAVVSGSLPFRFPSISAIVVVFSKLPAKLRLYIHTPHDSTYNTPISPNSTKTHIDTAENFYDHAMHHCFAYHPDCEPAV
ncbi:hypothetical protein PIB30_085910 [Stylosanthes scabra]|uniref:Uncharacterized protein n=1 Tax=Stylosanthes scabra TaxID=79078 RepID=A0ABU6YT94_9FABA|nr:hypothetical protein [Stylosanthes scabra]